MKYKTFVMVLGRSESLEIALEEVLSQVKAGFISGYDPEWSLTETEK